MCVSVVTGVMSKQVACGIDVAPRGTFMQARLYRFQHADTHEMHLEKWKCLFDPLQPNDNE